MTAQEIVNAVRSEVVEPNPAFFNSTALLRWLNRAQSNYVRRVRCLQATATFSTVIGQAAYALPATWLGSEKVFYNFPVNGVDSWQPLTPISIEKLAQQYPNFLSDDPTMNGKPSVYYIRSGQLNIFPKPQTNGTNDLFMFFECKPATLTALSDSISIDDSLSDALEAYLLWKMWKQDQEKEEATDQLNRYEKEIGEGLKWKKKQMLDGKWKIDIESFLPFNYSSVNNSAFNNQLNPLNL